MNDASHKIIGFMNRAIESHLETKGYALGDKPDLIVVYQVSLDRGQKVTIEQIPAKGRVYTRPLLEAVNEAKILVNAYDPATDKVVWKASTTRDVTNVDASKIDQERVNLRVSEIFESFPAKN